MGKRSEQINRMGTIERLSKIIEELGTMPVEGLTGDEIESIEQAINSLRNVTDEERATLD